MLGSCVIKSLGCFLAGLTFKSTTATAHPCRASEVAISRLSPDPGILRVLELRWQLSRNTLAVVKKRVAKNRDSNV
ncbi:hypothetical protein BKA64DRAFT_660223 [Cadophora sp. MPI-SDFR-AT-0126]|nr:hypothetical protein BKA64DRAFT_660223 [Leotiomycetes sp. MPI-SDFR-AT-0126]